MSRNRRPDWRRIKAKYSYTVEEAARTLNVHRNTVRNWIRTGGLAVMNGSRPHLILGAVLFDHLKAKRLALKRKCDRGELYCFKCRAPRKPVAELVEHRPMPSGRTRIVTICSTCEGECPIGAWPESNRSRSHLKLQLFLRVPKYEYHQPYQVRSAQFGFESGARIGVRVPPCIPSKVKREYLQRLER
jgi:Helix-turn-helix domain